MPAKQERRDEFQNWIDTIEDQHLHALLDEVFREEVVREAFLCWPAASRNHHAQRGGLFEHTMEVVKVVGLFCDLYPTLNRDLAITIALLHDVGKIYTYSRPSGGQYTLEGRLVGHLAMSTTEVFKALKKLPDFPKRLRAKVLHGIVSHHGKLEQGSPVAPMIPEAVLVYYADHLSGATVSALEMVEAKRKRMASHHPSFDWDSEEDIFTERNIFTGTRLYCG